MPLDEDGEPDYGPLIDGTLAEWRQANPGALVANICAIAQEVTDADFVHLAGVRRSMPCSI